MEIDKAPLVEIACGIGTVGDGRCIAQPADAGETPLILRLDQVQLGDQATGCTVGCVQSCLVFVVEALARSPLDGDIALVAIKDGQADRKCRARRINGCRVVRVIGCNIELWELLDDRLPQLLLLRVVARRESKEVGAAPRQIE